MGESLFSLTPGLMSQDVEIGYQDEIVVLSGRLLFQHLTYNPFYRGFDLLQIDRSLYPEKNLFFMTVGPRNTVYHFILLSSGRLLLVSPIQGLKVGMINLTGITYSRAFGNRLSLVNDWGPASTEFRFPSVYRVNQSIHLGGVVSLKTRSHPIKTNGYPFALLPETYCPTERQIFPVATTKGKARLDILPNGWCLFYVNNDQRQFISLEGVSFQIPPSIPHLIGNEITIPISPLPPWRKGEVAPHLVVDGSLVYLSGLVTRTLIHPPRNTVRPGKRGWSVITKVPEEYRPSKNLFFRGDDFFLSSMPILIVLTVDGFVKVWIDSAQKNVSLAGTVYVWTKN